MQEVDEYTHEHFYRGGVATVFVKSGKVTLCIESHQFQPKNYWYALVEWVFLTLICM